MEKDMLDFKKIGFKAGLEIHQQLDTQKLFCSCRGDNEDEFDFEVKRRLSISKSELGEVDAAALHELKKSKEFVYRGSYKTSCLVELDEEPPHEISQEPLKMALQIVNLFKANPVDSIEFMRKIVIDGSNTSGFQRTALIATNGKVVLGQKQIPIDTICLEEDSAKLVKREREKDIYHLCRLGVPLVEITTAPSITSPKELKGCAKEIGLILRSVKVKRGLGTIRQDVNLSIKNGARVEIKGAQNLKELDAIAFNEAKRQLTLLEVKDTLKKRKAKVMKEPKDVTPLFKDTKSKVLRKELNDKGKVKAVLLKGFKGILGKKLSENRRVGTEISDYAKSYSKLKGLFHRDELPNYGITDKEVKELEKRLKARKEDSFILVAGKEEECDKFLNRAIERLELLMETIPKEVRLALPDGSSKYLRPMPGAARMYPETDIPEIYPREIEISEVRSIKSDIKKITGMGIPKQEATRIAKSDLSELFFNLVKSSSLKPSYIYTLLFSKPKEFKKKYKRFDFSKVEESKLKSLLGLLDKAEIDKNTLEEAYLDLGIGKKLDIKRLKDKGIAEDEIRDKVREILKQNPDQSFGFLMGRCMASLKGADGKKVSRILKEEMN
jgi:glutamyl-tRNA(Gln) amidotransferase subunit E